jgi:16S rRNA (guanine527-N7)-methyltransferase
LNPAGSRLVFKSTGTEERVDRWFSALLETPGLTSIREPEEAWRVHVERSLAALPVVLSFEGPIVDVGSGGGAPGIPLAAALPERDVTLLEAQKRKAAFLERAAAEFPNITVVRGRAEEQELEQFGVAVAKALAPPPVALEWCLPLVRIGGAAILYAGRSVDLEAAGRAAAQLGGATPVVHPGVVAVVKAEPTPPGFPRRLGLARKRPLS